MPTFTTIGQNVLTRLGLMDPGSGLNNSDLVYLQNICNEMLAGWNLERPLIYTIAEQVFPLTTNVGAYTIGTGGAIAIPAPNRIEMAFFIDASGARTQLDVVPAQKYRSHRDLTATAKCPDELYPDYNFAVSQATLFFWPIPVFAGLANGAIEFWQPLPSFPDLTTSVPLKDGYQNCIELNLAYLACLTAFGEGVDVTTKQQVTQDAALSKQRIEALNRENGLVPATELTGMPLANAQQPASQQQRVQ